MIWAVVQSLLVSICFKTPLLETLCFSALLTCPLYLSAVLLGPGEDCQSERVVQDAESGCAARAVSEHVACVNAAEVREHFFDQRVSSVRQVYGLSAREAEVFAELAGGWNADSIGKRLCISPYTVKTHAYRIYRKLDVHSQQEILELFESGDIDENIELHFSESVD